jgi:23S rRNA pseudouridine1911/1915/1917 synthase
MESDASGEIKTLLDWAVKACPDTSRKQVKAWVAAGRFCLDGVVETNAGSRMKDPGARLSFGKPDLAPGDWNQRKRIHPRLVLAHLDSDLAIVDKEAGLLSVPSALQSGLSALDILSDYLNDHRAEATRRAFFGSAAAIEPLPVHRLDQFTSGLLCIAFSASAREGLIEQLRSHKFLREYIAYANGDAPAPSGTWRNFLALGPGGYHQHVVDPKTPDAVEAVTHYKVERHFARNHVSKLRIRLETGLKHQIRIQAAANGMPLIGDRSYDPATKAAYQKKGAPIPYNCKRQALHATMIGIQHPKDGRDLRFESQIPRDLQVLEARFERSGASGSW